MSHAAMFVVQVLYKPARGMMPKPMRVLSRRRAAHEGVHFDASGARYAMSLP